MTLTTDREDRALEDRAVRNRENAQHSTGPRTAEGKQKVRLNAVKHGATSKQVLLPGESPAAFDTLSNHLASLYDPQTEHERDILHTIRDLKWKIQRLDRFEDSFMFTVHAEALAAVDDTYADPDGEALDDRTRYVLAEGKSYKENRTTLNQLHRHGRTLRREMRESETFLQAAIAARIESEPEDQVDAIDQQKAAALREAQQEMQAEMLATDPGFVLHASPDPSAPRPRTPKFAGPNRKQDRKKWLRSQGKAA